VLSVSETQRERVRPGMGAALAARHPGHSESSPFHATSPTPTAVIRAVSNCPRGPRTWDPEYTRGCERPGLRQRGGSPGLSCNMKMLDLGVDSIFLTASWTNWPA